MKSLMRFYCTTLKCFLGDSIFFTLPNPPNYVLAPLLWRILGSGIYVADLLLYTVTLFSPNLNGSLCSFAFYFLRLFALMIDGDVYYNFLIVGDGSYSSFVLLWIRTHFSFEITKTIMSFCYFVIYRIPPNKNIVLDMAWLIITWPFRLSGHYFVSPFSGLDTSLHSSLSKLKLHISSKI